jgi:sugar lactone lactonase YvrE
MSALERVLDAINRLSRPTALLGATVLFAASLLTAQGTKLWNQSQIEEFEKGTPQGVAITSDGRLRDAPGLSEVLTTPSTFVWSLVADKSGTTFVGTGAPATVLRVGADQKPFTLFKTKDVNVQVVRVGLDGAIYAATLPGGKVYKLKADATSALDDSSATVVFDASKIERTPSADKSDADKAAKPHYIWDLAFDPTGRIYVATGDPGAIYRVDPAKPAAAPETFFKSDEAHIRVLAWDGKGNLLAGSDGSGLVYRISPDGKGYVLFDSPRREVTSLAVGSNGTIYAACVGDKGHNPLPPLPVQGVGAVTITIIQPGSMQATNQSASVPEGTEIYALKENQAPRKLWNSKDDIVYALVQRTDGLLALTGNRGRLFRIEDNGTYADIGHLNAQQGLSLAVAGADSVLLGTGNTGKIFKLGAAASHEYASDVLDAGAFARFGRVEISPGSTGYQVLTRTGNIEQPVRGWTDWQALNNGVVASPPGRFLQWKVQLQPGGEVGSVGVNYLPVNTAPVVDDMVVVPGARFNPQNVATNQPTVNITFPSANQNAVTFDSGSNTNPLQATKDRTAITVRWAAHDDDGDDLVYALYLRGDGESVWRLLKDKITEKAYSFDSTQIPDGGYQIRVVASDAPSETPGDALTGEKASDRFVIDTTPPVISALKATGGQVSCTGAICMRSVQIVLDANDSVSPVTRAEYSIDAGPWQYVDPVGKLSDSLHEHYDFKITVNEAGAKAGEHLITVRAYDRYDNVGLSKMVIPGQ